MSFSTKKTAAAIICIMLLCSFLLAWKTTENNKNTGIFTQEKQELHFLNIGGCGTQDFEKIKCLSQQVDKLNFPISQIQLHLLLEDLNYLEKENSIDTLTCHLVAHEIGKDSLKSKEEIFDLMDVNLYSDGSDYTCANGYYHGILMGYLEKYKKINERIFIEIVRQIISEAKAKQHTTAQHDNFFHSLGHSIYIYTTDNVDRSLKICDEVTTENTSEQNLCFYGVYMQMSFDRLSIGLSTPIDYCYKVKERYKNACYSGVRFDPQDIKDNLDKYSKICESESDDSIKLSCIKNFIFQFAGRDVEPATAYQFCNSLKDKKLSEICYFYYPKIYSLYYSSNKDSELTLNRTCDQLAILERIKCRKLYFSKINFTVYTEINPDDVYIPSLNIADIKYLFK